MSPVPDRPDGTHWQLVEDDAEDARAGIVRQRFCRLLQITEKLHSVLGELDQVIKDWEEWDPVEEL